MTVTKLIKEWEEKLILVKEKSRDRSLVGVQRIKNNKLNYLENKEICCKQKENLKGLRQNFKK